MITLSTLESLGLMEYLIFGFIGANIVLTGSFLIQRSLKRMTSARAQR